MQFDLVFEGGGIRGIVFVGALREFARRGHTPGRIMGTSAGAITATALAVGYDADDMFAALTERSKGQSIFTRFLGQPQRFDPATIDRSSLRTWLRSADLPFVPNSVEENLDDWVVDTLLQAPIFRHLFSLVELGGWFAADEIVAWMARMLDSGSHRGQPRRFSQATLAELYAATQVDLTLLATDVTDGRLLVLNHRTAPDCPVVWAVRMSMSIPFLWQEVLWQASWGRYRNKEIAGHAVVDGGVLANFPIELFITDAAMWTAVMGPKQHNHLIGLLIDDGMAVPGASAPPAGESGGLPQLATLRRINAVINTMLSARDKAVIEAYERFVVRLPAKGYGVTEFDLSDARRDTLVAAGEQSMRDYLDIVELAPPMALTAPGAIHFTRAADAVAARILGE
jgi:predicted acylesterase/phospholipase RssA